MTRRITTTLLAVFFGLFAACDGGGGPHIDVGQPDAGGGGASECDLRLSKSVDGDTHAGGTATYEIIVDNVGDAACNPPVVVNDSLPPGITHSSTLSANWSCTTVSTQPDELECSYSNGSIPPNGSPLLRFEVNIGDQACMASNCAEVSNGRKPGQGDQIPGVDGYLTNNRDCDDGGCGEIDDCTDPPSGMVGWWTADQTTDDRTGEQNHGSLVNGAYYSTGKVLESFKFDGHDDYVEVPDDDSLDFGAGDQFTIDAWIYPEKSENNVDFIVDKRGPGTAGAIRGYALQLRSNKLIVRTQNGSSGVTYSSSGSVPSKEWTHVAVTVDLDADQGTVYLDGTQDGTFNPSSTGAGSVENSSDLYIGRNKDDSQFFDGRIDEVEIFDRVLDPSEVSALYDAGSCGKCRVQCDSGEETYTAGKDDQFQNGTDSASPSTYLQNQYGPLKPFDDDTLNAHFGHTFGDLKPTLEYQYICSAKLEIRMRPSEGTGLDYNDTITLSFANGVGKIGARIGKLLGSTWTSSSQGAHTFTIDLANLSSPFGTTSIMPQLDSHAMLNVHVQDDTEVDYAKLHVDYECEACEFQREEPDLAVEKSHHGDFTVGQTGLYKISVDNTGSGDASAPTEISDEVPKCMKIEGIKAPWDAWCNVSGQQISCSYPDPIPAGGSAPDIEVEVTPTGECGDRVENCASVSHDDDTNSSNDESCDQSPVQHEQKADLAIEKSHPGKMKHGSVNSYNIVVRNHGPGAAQTPIEVTDSLAKCLTFAYAAPSGWNCSTSSGNVTCKHPGPLPSGQSQMLELNVDVKRGCGDVVKNCAKVTPNSDPDTSNNKACDTSKIQF